MILSDDSIRQSLFWGQLQVDPMPPDSAFQPASLELRLAETKVLSPEGGVLPSFCLSHTLETVTIPDHLVAQVNGKSSWARLGLQVHATAGYIDPGFSGQVTLELKNLGPDQLVLDAGIPICQLVFLTVQGPVLRPYGHPELNSHYQHQTGTTKSYLEE
jgi:dCTP deaminase